MKILEQVTDELQANVIIAEKQDEYTSLPAHVFPNGLVCCCIELSKEELEEVKNTGKVYVSHLTFKGPLQPFFVTTKQDLFKEHIELYNK